MCFKYVRVRAFDNAMTQQDRLTSHLLELVSSVIRGMPSSSDCSFVLMDVGTATMSFSSPDASFWPSRSTAKAAVEPVPSPTTMPLVT